MARYGATLTVKPGQITGTVSNLTWYLDASRLPVAAVDGGVKSILNGGGNARFYTDSTKATRISVELVTFVTGVTPNIHVRGLSSSLAVGGTIYIEGDTVETSQPAFDAAFGRNAVWAEKDRAFLFGSAPESGVLVDSAGNSDALEVIGSFEANDAVLLDGRPAWNFKGGGLNVDFPGIIKTDLGYGAKNTVRWISLTFNIKSLPTSGTAGIYQFADVNADASPVDFLQYQASSGLFRFFDGAYRNLFAPVVGDTYRFDIIYDGTSFLIYVDGLLYTSFTSSGGAVINASSVYWIGTSYQGYINAYFSETTMSNGYTPSAELIEAEYNNQSNPSAFWSVGAWEDQDAAGELNIVGSTPSYSYAVPTASVDLTGELNIVGSTPSYSYAVPTASVDLTGELNIVGSTPSYSYAVPTASVDLTGELNIVGSTPSYSYAVPTASVDLTGALVIVATTPTYSYNAVNAVVAFSGTITFSGDVILNSLQFSGHDIKAPVATFASISGDITFNKY